MGHYEAQKASPNIRNDHCDCGRLFYECLLDEHESNGTLHKGLTLQNTLHHEAYPAYHPMSELEIDL